MTRQIAFDTETTGLSPKDGHRVIEIGAVELINRRLTGNNFHCYLNPDREVDPGAFAVHGIGNDFLADKPHFVNVVEDFLKYIEGAELIIHNAPFDVGFMNHELSLIAHPKRLEDYCRIFDTLPFAREKHPGQRNSLDALCKRYEVNNDHRELHGALLDSEILADVYLMMTGGQVTLALDGQEDSKSTQKEKGVIAPPKVVRHTKLVKAAADNIKADEDYFK